MNSADQLQSDVTRMEQGQPCIDLHRLISHRYDTSSVNEIKRSDLQPSIFVTFLFILLVHFLKKQVIAGHDEAGDAE